MKCVDNTVLYIGNFLFPTNGAAAKRVLNIGRALKLSGYDVIFMGNNDYCRDEDNDNDGYYKYDGFEYYFRDINSGIKRRIDNYYSFPRVLRTIEKIEATGRKINAIIGYHMDFLGMMACIKYCKNRGIAFISDCTEWYDPCQTVHGRFGLTYYNSQLRMIVANKKANGIIVISKYLEQYYNKYTKVIRVPALDNVKEDKCYIIKNNNIIRFVYCGTPGKKDNLCGIWDAFERLGCEKKWEFHIVGINENHPLFIKRKYSAEVIARFIFHGYLPSEEAQTIIRNSDFSILIRPESKRYAKAGFPTKFSESFSLGTPVIANISSDLADYLVNGENGIVVKGSSELAITDALEYALNLTSNEVHLMRDKAYICATQSFDYRQYTNQIADFMK